MLNTVDLTKLSPYLSDGKVVNIEVKDRGRKGREVLLEYEDGRKLVGDSEPEPDIDITAVPFASYCANTNLPLDQMGQ